MHKKNTILASSLFYHHQYQPHPLNFSNGFPISFPFYQHQQHHDTLLLRVKNPVSIDFSHNCNQYKATVTISSFYYLYTPDKLVCVSCTHIGKSTHMTLIFLHPYQYTLPLTSLLHGLV
jgi:hypothetical protein